MCVKNTLDKDDYLGPSNLRMIENILKRHHEFTSKEALHNALPRYTPTKELDKILNQLDESDKITYDKRGTIVWIPLASKKLKRIWDDATPWESIVNYNKH